MAFNRLKCSIKLYFLKKKWRKLNQNNHTEINTLVDLNKINVGVGTYGVLNIIDYCPRTGTSKVKIGNYCSIADDVTFLLGGGHNWHALSTYPFRHFLLDKEESLSKGDIVLSDDVWIGTQVTIMSGVKIGKGAVIGTKALVTKDIPDYAIAVGIPAKVIKYRFSPSLIKNLKNFDMSKLNESNIKENMSLLTMNLTEKSLQKLERNINE